MVEGGAGNRGKGGNGVSLAGLLGPGGFASYSVSMAATDPIPVPLTPE
jgi:hypothetical protein